MARSLRPDLRHEMRKTLLNPELEDRKIISIEDGPENRLPGIALTAATDLPGQRVVARSAQGQVELRGIEVGCNQSIANTP